MAYDHLPWKTVADKKLRDLCEHADMYMHDAYGMFCLPVKDLAEGGGCQFSIALVLLCVVDGFAEIAHPTVANDDGQRFKKVLREDIFWGPVEKGWVERGMAAKTLYVELRNPLVHTMAIEDPEKIGKNRPEEWKEPVIGKWGRLPKTLHDIARIDALENWEEEWPILSNETTREDGPRMKLCAAGLYWAVKHLLRTRIQDHKFVARAGIMRSTLERL